MRSRPGRAWGILVALLVGAGLGRYGCGAPMPTDGPRGSAAEAGILSRSGDRPRAPATDGAWAEPIERPGLPNFHRVAPRLYRGAQATAEGMRELERMGIRTVVNLRSFHSDREKIEETGLAYEHIYMKAWHPEDEEVVRFLRIATDPARTPVFVHCQHGADRTGTMCAIYRIAVEGWSKEEAIREMTEGDFGYHDVWDPFLIDYIEDLDVDAIRRRAGLLD